MTRFTMNNDFIFVPHTPICCRDAYYQNKSVTKYSPQQMSHLLLFEEQFLKNRVSSLLA